MHQILIGGKALYPNASITHGLEGWVVLVGQTPEGKNDGEHLWIGHADWGWTRVHAANAAYVRYWRPGDENVVHGAGQPLMDKRIRDALEKRGELAK